MATLQDIIIIGAGPASLALAARLREQTPSAIFTDEEHARYHWIRKHGGRMSLKKKTGGRVLLPKSEPEQANEGKRKRKDGGERRYKTLTLDAHADTYLENWHHIFQLLEITHLRSPMFFHIDPADRDGLLAYTHERGREGELREIAGCVGQEVSKHRRAKQMKERRARGCCGRCDERNELGGKTVMEGQSEMEGRGDGRVVRGKGMKEQAKAPLRIDERDRKDYYTPSASLFADHCAAEIRRYGLDEPGLVRKGVVKDVDFGFVDPDCFDDEDGIVFAKGEEERVFTVQTDKGVHYARTVVVAIGAGAGPSIPPSLSPVYESVGGEGICHGNKIRELPHPRVATKIKRQQETNVLIVGGGLTAAQLVDLAVRRGVGRMWLVMRRGMKVKPFDVALPWLGKFRNHEKAVFWSADSDAERLEAIRTARDGGSVTPPYHRLLKSYITKGKLRLLTHTAVSSAVWDAEVRTWSVQTDPPMQGLEGVKMDYIYLATGVAPDFERVSALETLQSKWPIQGYGGLPCLSEDLMWKGSVDGAAYAEEGRAADSKVDGKIAIRRMRKDSGAELGEVVDDVVGNDQPAKSATEDDPQRIPLFLTGRLASLRLGPGAGNLEGARMGAERIAWALNEILDSTQSSIDDRTAESEQRSYENEGKEMKEMKEQVHEDAEYKYAVGIGSRYEMLSEESGEQCCENTAPAVSSKKRACST